MAEVDNNTWELIPMDVIVKVLLRLPTSSRRRFRLVCRLWRDTIDMCTTEMWSRPKTLVASVGIAYLEGLPSSSSSDGSAEGWTGDAYYDGSMTLVGTCNGLVCLWDSEKPDEPITLANWVTGETLALPLPPLPHAKAVSDSRLTYTFAYHPTTGRYKVLHVPFSFDRVWVFTLGEALWRDVATGIPIETYDLSKGIVGIDGTVYWAVKGTKAKIMSFDLDNEHIAFIRPLPNVLSRQGSWYLTEARGRLGVAFSHKSASFDKTEVWVTEHAMAGQRRWSLWYNLHMQKLDDFIVHQHEITQPNFTTHDNGYVMTTRWGNLGGGHYGYVLYKHKSSNDVKKARHGVVEISESNQGAVVAVIPSYFIRPRTFAHVETTEPLSVYRCW